MVCKGICKGIGGWRGVAPAILPGVPSGHPQRTCGWRPRGDQGGLHHPIVYTFQCDPRPRSRPLGARHAYKTHSSGLNNRILIVLLSLALMAVGLYVTTTMPVDVFPDFAAPTVTILTEAHGMAPTEVETLVTFPI